MARPRKGGFTGLDRSAVVEHLTLMAAVLSASALLPGALAERLRRAGVSTELFLVGTLTLSMAAQLGLLLGVPVSSYLLFAVITAAGATTVQSFAILAQYFPKEVSGRTNAALGVINVGAAFGLRCLSGLIALWPSTDGYYPAQAHEAAMAAGLALQLISLAVFFAPKRRLQQTPMAYAVARALGIDPSGAATMPSRYRAALPTWRRHVVDTRRQAAAWRFAAVACTVLCIGLAGCLMLALASPAVALHVVQDNTTSRNPFGAELAREAASLSGTPAESRSRWWDP